VTIGNVCTPSKNIPESAYFTNCAAIIDAILDLYRGGSYKPYEQIKMQWATPGCRSFIKPLQDEASKNNNAGDYFLALAKLFDNIARPDNEDWKQQEYLIADWIKKYCNRQSDLKKGKVNIQVKTSKYLLLALGFRSLADYQGLNFDDMNVYRGEANDILEETFHSRERDKLVQQLKKAGLNLQYGDNIRDSARLWVKARVLRTDTIEEFTVNMNLSKKNLLDRLFPFDKAMGYIRQPG